MTVAAPDLIAGYLAEMGAGLWVPAAEAELILAEAEDHLRETAAAGLAAGMTELEAQQAAISSFGPVRAVIWAHRRRRVTARDAALAAWKLAALLATTVGAGGLAGVGIFVFLPHRIFVLHSASPGPPGILEVGPRPIQVVPGPPGPAVIALVCAAMAVGGLALLATRRLAARRLARRGPAGRDRLAPAVTASFFLLASALLVALTVSGVAVLIDPITVYWNTPIASGSISAAALVPGAVVAACLAVAAGYGVQAALRRARQETRCTTASIQRG